MDKQLYAEQEQQNMHLHQNLKLLRKRLKLSQEELARQIGLNRGNIASYENGTAEPKICNLLKFARLFKIPVHKLTYSDLSSELKVDELENSDAQSTFVQHEMVQQLAQQLEQTEELMRSIRTCCCYRNQSQSGSSQEMQAFMVYFEELYQVAEKLLDDQRKLLELKEERTGRTYF